MSNGESDFRDKLAIALDVDDLVAALRIARDVRPWFGVAKVGLELFIASGPEAIGALIQLGYKVFLDLKLDDIPTTVERAARIAGSLGVHYLTVHARGGVNILRAGVNGLTDGAQKAGLPQPVALGVTVLTSDDSAPPHIFPQRVQTAVTLDVSRSRWHGRRQPAAEPELLTKFDCRRLLGQQRIGARVDREAVHRFIRDHAAAPRSAFEHRERDAVPLQLVGRRAGRVNDCVTPAGFPVDARGRRSKVQGHAPPSRSLPRSASGGAGEGRRRSSPPR